MKLPNEEKWRTIIRDRLESELKLASKILDLGCETCSIVKTVQPPVGLDDHGMGVVLGLVAKACKQYRAIGAMVELALGEVAESNTRMLFETMLAVEFILRRRVILKQGGKRVPLPTKLRTKLYIANVFFNERKFAHGLLRTPGLKRTLSKKLREEVGEAAREWENLIGPDWTKRLTQGRGYAGIGVEQLAERLGFGHLYASIYRIQSTGVHAGDALDHAYLEQEWPFTEGRDSTGRTLGWASQVLIKVVQRADERLGLGLKSRTDRILAEIERMKLKAQEAQQAEPSPLEVLLRVAGIKDPGKK